MQAFSQALTLEPDDALALYGRRAVATQRSEAANGQSDSGAAFINDPDIARMMAASGISPVADLAEVPSPEP
jgi:hypothetical protein